MVFWQQSFFCQRYMNGFHHGSIIRRRCRSFDMRDHMRCFVITGFRQMYLLSGPQNIPFGTETSINIVG